MSVLVESRLTQDVPNLNESTCYDHGNKNHKSIVFDLSLVLPNDIEHKDFPTNISDQIR